MFKKFQNTSPNKKITNFIEYYFSYKSILKSNKKKEVNRNNYS